MTSIVKQNSYKVGNFFEMEKGFYRIFATDCCLRKTIFNFIFTFKEFGRKE